MVIIFPYACFVEKKPFFLVDKRRGAWPTGLLNSEAVNLDLAKLIPDEAHCGLTLMMIRKHSAIFIPCATSSF